MNKFQRYLKILGRKTPSTKACSSANRALAFPKHLRNVEDETDSAIIENLERYFLLLFAKSFRTNEPVVISAQSFACFWQVF